MTRSTPQSSIQSSPQATPGFFRRSTRDSAAPAIGTRLVFGLVVLGTALASFAIWFQWQQTRRCLDFYGSAVARRIQVAPRVELWERLGEDEISGAGGEPRPESALRFDISRARGLVHLRRGLVEDANFDWTRRGATGGPWDAALAFYDRLEDREPAAVLAFQFGPGPGGGTVTLGAGGEPVGLGRLEKGLRAWLAAARAESGPPAAANRAF